MQGFIKDNKLIVNTMIQKDEREEILDYIKKAKSRTIKLVELYDINGDISGISFEIN